MTVPAARNPKDRDIRHEMLEDLALSDNHVSNVDFARAHHDKLRAEFPNQWVAIRDGKAIASSDTVNDLLAELRRRS